MAISGVSKFQSRGSVLWKISQFEAKVIFGVESELMSLVCSKATM